jgi:hypothetical protein
MGDRLQRQRNADWNSRSTGLALAMLLLGAPWPSGEAAETATPPASDGVTNAPAVSIPKSVFFIDKEKGRDPFYPRNPRRGGGSVSPTPDPVIKSVDELVDRFVVLRGITGQEGNRVALINNQTFKVGDSTDVRLGAGDQRLNLTLLKILERSVVFKAVGSDREFEKALSE